ncbi:MAG: catalase family peroxidase [Burkholderiales bacterium]|nr:catalase family peroxidase [Burkholderiales bacterium]
MFISPAQPKITRSPIALATLLCAVLATSPVRAEDAPAADQTPLPVALVKALNQLSGGPHPGYRANHAKGVMVTGTFTPAASARSLSKAPHFLHAVPVTVRFSDTTGVPTLPDADPNASPHGMAIRFQLPKGATTDIVSISANGFPVATPEDFLALLQAVGASGPGAAKPTPIEQFLGSHPAAAKFVMTPRPAPESFATLAFYGVNAFKFTNAKGKSSYIRYQILPVAGEHALSDDAAAKAAPNYLMDELPVRVAKAPVKFKLLAQVANEGDNVNDPTAVWPTTNRVVELGTLSLTKAVADQASEQKKILYNPVSLTAGIEPSADPVLAMRFPAYAVSFGQRAQ